KEVTPTLWLNGRVAVTNGTYRNVPFSAAQTHFIFTNLTWHLPDLLITRPEGEARVSHSAHAFSREFTWSIDSRIDPQALRPLLMQNEQQLLDEFQFTQPPHFRGEIAGRWYEPETTTLSADIAVTNLTF